MTEYADLSRLSDSVYRKWEENAEVVLVKVKLRHNRDSAPEVKAFIF